ncbi:DUF1877 family protein [Desulfoluna butyratoxydans]|uniref:DUF1877 family protein n=1 Tax=Desulfoluna butyratoxydans TaxID=231438 RepID=UPI003CCE2645
MTEELNRFSVEQIRRVYSPLSFNNHEIYPEFTEWGECSVEPILDYYLKLVSYYNQAANNNYSMIIYIS